MAFPLEDGVNTSMMGEAFAPFRQKIGIEPLGRGHAEDRTPQS